MALARYSASLAVETWLLCKMFMLRRTKSMLQYCHNWMDGMTHLSQLGWLLHEEHFRILALICGIEQRVSGDQAKTPLDPRRPKDLAQLEELSDSLDALNDHNGFEEAVVFPLACDGGEGDLTKLLSEEHGIIGPLTRRLQHLVCALIRNGDGDGRWAEFCRTARQFVGCMMDHLQNEEQLLVQRLPAFIDTETDRSLAHRYGPERSKHRFGLALQEIG